MKIAVIGTGYVGLVAGTCFANAGNDVICVDKRQDIVDTLAKGIPTIYEPGLGEILERVIETPDKKKVHSKLLCTTDLGKAIEDSEIIFIAVGTPMSSDGTADLTAVLEVAKSIGTSMNGYKIIVTKSTVPVGTGNRIEEVIKNHTHHDFDVVFNPEFLKEGSAIEDFSRPDRVIIGFDPDTKNKDDIKYTFEHLYKPFMRNKENRLIFMNRESAELTKYAANAMLATRISFINEIAQLAERVGANIDDIRSGIGSDSRIGNEFLYAGPGYGGSCFPKDVSALGKIARTSGVELKVVSATQQANMAQRDFFLNKILDFYDHNVSGKKFALWGLAFKAKTDDVRMSPAIFIADMLTRYGADVIAYDPEAMQTAQNELGDTIHYGEDQYSILDDADALIIMTEWETFRTPDFSLIQGIHDRVIFDSRNLYEINDMKDETTLAYISIGRPTIDNRAN